MDSVVMITIGIIDSGPAFSSAALSKLIPEEKRDERPNYSPVIDTSNGNKNQVVSNGGSINGLVIRYEHIK